METRTSAIQIKKTDHSRLDEVDFSQLEFGKYVSDHMLVCDYDQEAWGETRILPFGNLSLSPATLALHYGQTVFEGMKAFRMKDGRINLFRMERHYQRFVKSLNRMCMAAPPEAVFTEGLMALVNTDKKWVPRPEEGALYLRPFVYASEARFGVKVSAQYRFILFTGPVPDLFGQPIRLKAETEFRRAGRGGTGSAKCGGNYGGAFFPTQQAKQRGYDQVLWTGGEHHEFIEESGMMNVLFVMDGRLVTPPLSDSILDGVTRDSLLVLAKDMGIVVEERPVAVTELEAAFREKRITEAFGAGTAAVVAPIGVIHVNGIDYDLPALDETSLQNKLKHQLERIRTGEETDRHGWNTIIG